MPATNRNEADLTLVNGNFRIADSVDGGTGSATNNFENFIGYVSSGAVVVTVAVYWQVVSAALQRNPATHLYITTPASGIGATTFNLNSTSDRFVRIDGKQYTKYSTSSSAFATRLKAESGEQNWEFHTNAAGTADLNFKPATQLVAGRWHDVSHVESDATLSGSGTSSDKLSVANPFTPAEKTKLAGIATGAEANVKSDFNATSGDAEILNKPTIPTTVGNLTDVSVASPSQGESLVYSRASRSFQNTLIDNPTHANIDLVVNNISATSGDHLLYTYAFSDLQSFVINALAVSFIAYRLTIDTDQPFASVKLRQHGSSGAFTGSAAFGGIVSGSQTASDHSLTVSTLSPSFDIYVNRSTSTRATISRVRLFLYLYK